MGYEKKFEKKHAIALNKSRKMDYIIKWKKN